MRLICDGHTHREIAARLCVSIKTIDKHATAIRTKWGTRSAVQILRHAVLHDHYVILQWEGNPT